MGVSNPRVSEAQGNRVEDGGHRNHGDDVVNAILDDCIVESAQTDGDQRDEYVDEGYNERSCGLSTNDSIC